MMGLPLLCLASSLLLGSPTTGKLNPPWSFIHCTAKKILSSSTRPTTLSFFFFTG